MDAFLNKLTTWTEGVLTWRKKRRHSFKERQKEKGTLRDWVESFLQSALMVLLVNQYFFQAYEIPSPSMVETLLVKDRLFVNKLVYGPEILPGIGKLPGYAQPVRGDIIIFENPSYLSKGPVFDLVQRLLYMLTLSLVDIDKDEKSGEPKVHFLIKRGVGFDGDQVRFREGNLEFKLAGEGIWRSEDAVQELTGVKYHYRRVAEMDGTYYQGLRSLAGKFEDNLKSLGDDPEALRLQVMDFFQSSEPKPYVRTFDPYSSRRKDGTAEAYDAMEIENQLSRSYLSLHPQDLQVWAWNNRLTMGQYVPRDWILPLGDNRDHSRDGRFFGPLPREKILGQASLRIWPLGRFGEMH